jgi:hypothetical protein
MFFLNIAYFIYHWKIYRRGKFTGGENLQEGKIYRRGKFTGGENLQEGKIYRRGKFTGGNILWLKATENCRANRHKNF